MIITNTYDVAKLVGPRLKNKHKEHFLIPSLHPFLTKRLSLFQNRLRGFLLFIRRVIVLAKNPFDDYTNLSSGVFPERKYQRLHQRQQRVTPTFH